MPQTAPRTQTGPLVELRDVGFALAGQTILKNVDFCLEPGQCWGILGQSGAGKSNFLRILRGEAWPAPGAGARRYVIDGKEQKSPIAFRAVSRLVSSELLDRYQRLRLNLSLRELVRTGFDDSVYLHHRLDGAKEARVDEALAALGILDLAGRRMDALSRGQSRKALLARALVARPEALFLDECCEDLDSESAAMVLGILAGLAEDGVGIVYATHRPEELIPAFGHVALFQNGTIAKKGTRREMEPEIRAYAPAPGFDRAGPLAPAPMEASGFVAEITGADIYLDRRKVLSDINWRIDPGRHWAVWGENGAGKTTLLKLLAGDLRPAVGGDIRWFGGKDKINLWSLRKKISLVSAQFQTRHEHSQTGLETVLSGFTGSIGATRHNPGPGEIKAALFWLDYLGIPHLAERDVVNLSYGQMRGLLIARAMVTEPKLLLLDEPLAGLDPSFRREVTAMLRSLADRGASIILVTHHREDLFPEIGNLLALEKGRVIHRGPLEGYFAADSGAKDRTA